MGFIKFESKIWIMYPPKIFFLEVKVTRVFYITILGDSALVSVLLQAGANVCGLTSNDSISCSSPMKLAQDLGMTELVEIMTASYDADIHN